MPEAYNRIGKVRQKNEILIYSILRNMRSATTAQLSKETGISVVTCGKILAQLCSHNMVFESNIERKSLGRPSKVYTFNANYSYVAAIYVETDHNKISMSTVVSNLFGDIIYEQKLDHFKQMNYDEIQSALSQLMDQYPQIKYAAIGIPGYISQGIISLCNFTNLIGLPLQQMLQNAFPSLSIIIENDMNATAYGFYQSESHDSDDTVAVIYSPNPMDTSENSILTSTGIGYGAGFVSAGHIIRGFSGFAGEVSFLPSLPTYEDKYEQQISIISHIINCIIPILNPSTIALTGGRFLNIITDDIRSRCLRQIAPQHIPKIVIRPDFHHDYNNGLIELALYHQSIL